MSQIVRVSLIIMSFFLSVLSLVFLIMMINDQIYNGILEMLIKLPGQNTYKAVMISLALVILILCVTVAVYAVMSGRLRRTRIRSNEIGNIDIGVDAIESIALNAAKSAQCGIKAAKARVAPSKGEKISIVLSAVLYSDVEVPVMMAKAQDRVKKDIERYTGIPVAEVIVRVSRVEPVAARVER